MRLLARQITAEEDEESVFISMTDMTVGFLFIVLILLAFFASQFRDQDVVNRSEFDIVKSLLDEEMTKRIQLENDVLTLQTEITNLAQRISQLTLANSELQVENDQFRDHIRKLEDILVQLSTEIESLRAENFELKDRVQELERMLARLSAEATTLGAENLKLRDRVQDLERTLENNIAETKEIRVEIANLQDKNTEQVALIKSLLNQIEALKDRVAKLEKRLEDLAKIDPLEAYLAAVSRERNLIVRQLRDAIIQDFPDLEGVITAESDALRFQGQGLFASGSPRLRSQMVPVIHRIAERLHQILPCYTLGQVARRAENCNPSYAVIEAIQIEGHTDDVGGLLYNLNLSVSRATSTYSTMVTKQPELRQHLNLSEQPVLSVAGYGPDRPVTSNSSKEGKAENRRIDLRFIMVTPRANSEIEAIRKSLEEARRREN